MSEIEVTVSTTLQYWQNRTKPFEKTKDGIYIIPIIPVCNNQNDYRSIIVPALIRCGAIPKSKLTIGKKYKGSCRNASEAIWNGKQFTYERYKFGCTYPETINHFEDDNGYDVFVPVEES